jgi:hypothetical protein
LELIFFFSTLYFHFSTFLHSTAADEGSIAAVVMLLLGWAAIAGGATMWLLRGPGSAAHAARTLAARHAEEAHGAGAFEDADGAAGAVPV